MKAHDDHPVRADLPEKLRQMVDDRVDTHLNRLKEFGTPIISWALKLLSAALAIVLFALAFFGYKTSNDAQQRVDAIETKMTGELDKLEKSTRASLTALQNSAEERINRLKHDVDEAVDKGVKQRLAENDPVRYYQQRFDQHYDRALVTSYLISLNRQDNPLGRRTEVREEDNQRLTRILGDLNVDFTLFQDTLQVIASTRNRETSLALRGALHNLIDHQQDGVSAADKLVSFLTICTSQFVTGLEHDVRSLLDPDKFEERIVSCAISYLARASDFSSLKTIELLAASRSPGLVQKSLAALARMNPSSDVFQK